MLTHIFHTPYQIPLTFRDITTEFQSSSDGHAWCLRLVGEVLILVQAYGKLCVMTKALSDYFFHYLTL